MVRRSRRIAVPKTKDGISITVGDVITSILDFYHTHPYISYGGLDAVQEYSDSFEFTVYAGILGIPEILWYWEVIRRRQLDFSPGRVAAGEYGNVSALCVYTIFK